jgi:predicted YcjX-like family ATPase
MIAQFAMICNAVDQTAEADRLTLSESHDVILFQIRLHEGIWKTLEPGRFYFPGESGLIGRQCLICGG